MIKPPIRYPSGPLTPHAAYHFLKGLHPRVKLKAYDGSVEFELLGGPSIPDPLDAPECVRISGPIKGLIAPWKFIDQQGANEDGATYIDSVNEPGVIEIPVRCVARDGKHLRQVVDHLYGSIDKARQSQLSWFTFERGFWWADVRWADKPPGGERIGGQRRSLETTLVLRVDRAAWRTYDDVAELRHGYETLLDNFDTDYPAEKIIGPDWSVYSRGPGEAYPYAINGMVRVSSDPAKFTSTTGRTYMATHNTFTTPSNKQVVEITFGTMIELGGRNYILGRAGRAADKSWTGYGVAAELEMDRDGCEVKLVSFNNFQPTTIRSRSRVIPPIFGERWRLECGGLDAQGEWDDRLFRIKRGGATVLTAIDENNITPLGSSFRGAGFGGYTAGSTHTKGRPAGVSRISAGEAVTAGNTLSGVLRRINIGDQDRFDEYTLIGPGTFRIAAAAGSKDMVEFGPLLPNQMVQLRTDQRKRTVVDITQSAPVADSLVKKLPWLQQWLDQLLGFIADDNIGEGSNASAFGVPAPQGNMHRLLKGAFSKPIPPKSPGHGPQVVQVAAEIEGGNSDSAIIASGTSLRKRPN